MKHLLLGIAIGASIIEIRILMLKVKAKKLSNEIESNRETVKCLASVLGMELTDEDIDRMMQE